MVLCCVVVLLFCGVFAYCLWCGACWRVVLLCCRCDVLLFFWFVGVRCVASLCVVCCFVGVQYCWCVVLLLVVVLLCCVDGLLALCCVVCWLLCVVCCCIALGL